MIKSSVKQRRTKMKKLTLAILLLLVITAIAQAECRYVLNVNTGEMIYVCTEGDTVLFPFED